LTGDQIIAKGMEVIRIEGEAILNLQHQLNGDFTKTVNLIYNSEGRVVFTGVGKSGLIAIKIVATLNSTGTPSIFMHPTDALHGDLGMVRKGDTVIVISKSGNTEELINVIYLVKRLNIPVIGMLGMRNSNIGKECDLILDVTIKEEACPYDLAPTTSTTAALVMGDALSITLLEKRGFTQDDFAMLHPGGSLGKRLSLKISEIMYKGDDVPKVNEDTSLKETILVMTSKRLGMTCVIDEKNKLTGVVTDGDLRRLLEKSLDLSSIKASDMMIKNPKTISPQFLASFALQQMESFNITSLIATDKNNSPVGVVHLHELVKLGLQRR